MKKLLALFTLLYLLCVFTPRSYADGSENNVTINKTVLNPQTKTYVKNLGIGEALYHPNDVVIFHITLTNTSNQTVEQLIIKDIFPQYISFISGVGSFDEKNKILSFIAYNLKPNTTQTFAVSTKIVSSDQFLGSPRDICIANKATMLFGKNQTNQDTAQFCIENTGQTVQHQNTQSQMQPSSQSIYPPTKTKTSPSTGPSSWNFPSLIILALAGISLIRKANTIIGI